MVSVSRNQEKSEDGGAILWVFVRAMGKRVYLNTLKSKASANA